MVNKWSAFFCTSSLWLISLTFKICFASWKTNFIIVSFRCSIKHKPGSRAHSKHLWKVGVRNCQNYCKVVPGVLLRQPPLIIIIITRMFSFFVEAREIMYHRSKIVSRKWSNFPHQYIVHPLVMSFRKWHFVPHYAIHPSHFVLLWLLVDLLIFLAVMLAKKLDQL